MYRIIKTDGVELGMTDSVMYIRIGGSGCFTPCSADEAIGVAFQSVPYNLLGHEEIEGADTVIVSAVDGGARVRDITNVINILLGVAE